MSLFPIFLKLDGRRCLVIGAGKIGEPKIQSLLEAQARITVVAPHASDQVRQWAANGRIAWEARVFESSDLDDIFLVIAATSFANVNKMVFTEARRRKILCNSVDDPDHCDFFYPAIVRRGDLQLAISTAGHSPALAQRLRLELETQFGPEYGDWLQELGEARKDLFASDIDPEKRRTRLHELASRDAFQAAAKKISVTEGA